MNADLRPIATPKNTAPMREAPNAELTGSFEPLRVVFALSALVLGLLASFHP